MGKAHNPRRGSMQVWPRVRAKREHPTISGWPTKKDDGLLGFSGYKAGMTHVIMTDAGKNSITKGQDISVPATIIECPPLRIAGVRFYKKAYLGTIPFADILAKPDKSLAKKLDLPKKDLKSIDSIKPEECANIFVLIQTQPKLTGIGKKKPELFEMGLGGSVEDKYNWAKENLGKELSVKDVFKDGQYLDIHAVTTGKGYQGPVKRFGVKVRARKAEKTKRGPGSLGGWKGQAHVMYRIAHAGQMGYHNRVDYNKQVLKVGDDPKEVNAKGGFVNFGNVKSQFILLKGSVPGPKKRLIRMKFAARPIKRKEEVVGTIQKISTASQQRR